MGSKDAMTHLKTLNVARDYHQSHNRVAIGRNMRRLRKMIEKRMAKNDCEEDGKKIQIE